MLPLYLFGAAVAWALVTSKEDVDLPPGASPLEVNPEDIKLPRRKRKRKKNK